MAEGFRPVYASYRSLGPADLVSLEPKRRLAIQVKRTAAPIYVAESEWQRMAKWAEEQTMQPLLCRVDPDDGVLHWWEWQRAVRAGRRRRFDDRVSAPTAVELLRLS